MVNLLLQEQEQVVVEQVEQDVTQIVIKEQVEMVKMLPLFLDQHRNLFIYQTEQMLDPVNTKTAETKQLSNCGFIILSWL